MITSKSLSEALMYFCRTWGENVVYINCSECRKQFLYTTCSPHVLNLQFSCIELVHNSLNNLFSYCGLVDAKMRASDKDLSVHITREL